MLLQNDVAKIYVVNDLANNNNARYSIIGKYA